MSLAKASLAPLQLTETPSADPYLHRIRDLVADASGIFHPETKFYYLLDRCARRLQATGCSSLAAYHLLLTCGPDPAGELCELLNEITVGETCFFRNQPQLAALTGNVLPPLLEAKARLGFRQLRVWSAGCSTGEEAYTIAMVLREELGSRLRDWTLEVIATDLNLRSLERARQGLYHDYALRNVPALFRGKYFQRRGEQFQVRDELRSSIHFGRINLRDDSRMVFMKAMDVIFCCNVLIYFGAQPKRRVIQHFHNNLLPNGCLFLGHAESLFGISDEFRLVHYPLAAAYFKAGRDAGAVQ